MYTIEISVALLQGASSHAQEPCHHGSDVGLTCVYGVSSREHECLHGASESCSGPPTVCVRRGNRTQGRQEQMFRIDWSEGSNGAQINSPANYSLPLDRSARPPAPPAAPIPCGSGGWAARRKPRGGS